MAARTGTSVEFVAVWLASQAAAGYVGPGPAGGTYCLPQEHAAVLVIEGEGVSVAGGLRVAAAAFKDEPQVTEAFRTGVPPAARDRHPDLAAGLALAPRRGHGTERGLAGSDAGAGDGPDIGDVVHRTRR